MSPQNGVVRTWFSIIIFPTCSHAKTKIPTLFEAIDTIKELEMYMLLEVKNYNSQVISDKFIAKHLTLP